MDTLFVLKDLLVLLAVSVLISFIFNKLKLPSLVGFLVTGILIGPSGLKLIHEISGVEILAEIGVALLLFTIGLEFSSIGFNKIYKAALGGISQIAATAFIVTIIFFLITHDISLSIFIGFLISLSSTAIVMKSLIDKGGIDSASGNLSLEILLVQDLCVVPMMIIIPYLKNIEALNVFSFIKAIGLSIISLFITYIVTSLILPGIFSLIARTTNRELFTISTVVICLGIAYLTASLGFSLAIGAFLAGFILSKLEYRHQIIADVMPFRNIFNSVFFISIGMLVDLNGVFKDIFFVSNSVIGIIIIKFLIIVPIVLLLKHPLRVAIIVGLSLAQIGEFSFVLGKFGNKLNLISYQHYQSFIGISVISMIITPFLMYIAPKLGFAIQNYLKIPFKKEKNESLKAIKNHVVIIGYGVNGINLAKVLKEVMIDYVIVDINANLVKEAKDRGEPIYFGDFTKQEILEEIGIRNAKVAVIAISDPIPTRQGLWMIKNLNPNIYTIIRTKYTSQVSELQNLGADQVIPEEYETSIEIFSRVLRQYHVPRNIILTQVDIIRKEGYKMLRKLSLEPSPLTDLGDILAITLTETLIIKENSKAVNKTISELELKEKTGVTIIAIVRSGNAYTNPKSDFKIEANDMIIILGNHAELDKAIQYLSRF